MSVLLYVLLPLFLFKCYVIGTCPVEIELNKYINFWAATARPARVERFREILSDQVWTFDAPSEYKLKCLFWILPKNPNFVRNLDRAYVINRIFERFEKAFLLGIDELCFYEQKFPSFWRIFNCWGVNSLFVVRGNLGGAWHALMLYAALQNSVVSLKAAVGTFSGHRWTNFTLTYFTSNAFQPFILIFKF